MRFGSRFFQIETENKTSRICFFFSKKLDMITKEKMYVLYEIVDDVHWLMLTDIKHIKKVCCVLRVALNAH